MALLLSLCALSDTAIKGFCTDFPEAYSRQNQLRKPHYGLAAMQSHLIGICFTFYSNQMHFVYVSNIYYVLFNMCCMRM